MYPPIIDLPMQLQVFVGATLSSTNIGSLRGYAQLGDGVTAGTFPVMLGGPVKAGQSFNGSQYMQWLSPLANGTYTICALANKVTGPGTAMFLLDARAAGGAGYLWYNAAVLEASTGTCYVDEVATTSLSTTLCFIAATGITLNAPSKLVIAAKNDLTTPWNGNMFRFKIFNGTATARQLRDQRQRMLAELPR